LTLFSSLQWNDWLLLAGGAYLIGLNKAGLRGVNLMMIPLLASLLGGKTSSAVLLPLLLTGDFYALAVYRKKAELSYLKKMLPPAVLGLAAGMVIGRLVDDRVFTLLIAVFILVCLILMVYREFFRSGWILPDHWLAHGTGGFLGGLTTMVGHAAGPIMAAYLLALNLPKQVFIGTGAIFFLVLNLLKIPVQTLVWHTLTGETLLVSLCLVPFVLLGTFTGYPLVKRIPEKPFRLFIIITSAAGALKLFISLFA